MQLSDLGPYDFANQILVEFESRATRDPTTGNRQHFSAIPVDESHPQFWEYVHALEETVKKRDMRMTREGVYFGIVDEAEEIYKRRCAVEQCRRINSGENTLTSSGGFTMCTDPYGRTLYRLS